MNQNLKYTLLWFGIQLKESLLVVLIVLCSPIILLFWLVVYIATEVEKLKERKGLNKQ